MQIQVSLKMEIAASASLTEMEQCIQEAGQQTMREALKKAIRQQEDQEVGCPHCGETQRRLEGTMRRVIATIFGRVEIQRRRFRCQHCLRRWCPANRLFLDLKGGKISQELQEAAMLVGCSWPYRVASAVLKKLSGAQISAEEIRLLTNKRGKQRAEEQEEQAKVEQTKQEQIVSVPADPQSEQAKKPMLVGLNGGWVCSQEQRGGMEGEVAVVCSHVEDLPMPTVSTTFSLSKRGGPRHAPRQRHRLAQRRYAATFASSAHLGLQAGAASWMLSGDRNRPVVVLADGAEWIKTEQKRHFPNAICILDWAHLWREVSHALRAAARAKALPTKERDYQLFLHRSWLWHGDVDLAVKGLSALGTGLPEESLEVINKAITYLKNQRSWIGSYEQWRALGYPVGSGMIERAVALVINRRMKKRGMRWRRENATAVVALRTDVLNGDWMIPQRLRAFP